MKNTAEQMTRQQKQLLINLIDTLRKAENLADTLEITLSNGAEIGSIVGAMADELECRAEWLQG